MKDFQEEEKRRQKDRQQRETSGCESAGVAAAAVETGLDGNGIAAAVEGRPELDIPKELLSCYDDAEKDEERVRRLEVVDARGSDQKCIALVADSLGSSYSI